MSAFDVLGLGSVAVDELLTIDAFPAPDTKLRVASRERRCGGLTGVALLAAAALGARCAYAGRLGTDAASEFVAGAFARAGVDTRHAPRAAEHRVVESTIIVATQTGTRNVFSHSPGGTGAHDTLPPADAIRAARVLLVDHHGIPGSIRAAQIARAAGRAVVGDFERDDDVRFPELLALVDHLILSETFALRITGASVPAEAVARLWSPERQVVIVTCGAEGCWSAHAADATPEQTPAFRVETIDTTSCGDVFHGAYATALAEGMEASERIRFASAAAALKAARRSSAPLPTRGEVEAMLRI